MTLALFLQTVRESLSRRAGLLLIGASVGISLLFALTPQFREQDGQVVVQIFSGLTVPAERFVEMGLHQAISFVTGPLFFLGAFVLAGLLTAQFARGHHELLLTKPLTRAHLLAGRYLGALAVVFFSAVVFLLPIALAYRLRFAFPVGGLFRALLVLLLMYAVLAAVAQFFAAALPNTAVVILGSIAVLMLAGMLDQRELFLPLIETEWVRRAINYAYEVLPKFDALGRTAAELTAGATVSAWKPVWSSALFAMGCWSAAALLYSRRSY